jgi:polyhydroxyalkanoate synthase
MFFFNLTGENGKVTALYNQFRFIHCYTDRRGGKTMEESKTSLEDIFSKAVEGFEGGPAFMQKASEVLLGSLDTQIATTPYDIVYEEDRVQLKHYKPENESSLNSPLLINYALINKETMLDLQPERSVIKNLLKAGIELYVVDWGYPTRKDQYLTIDDHVNWYMDNIVDFILERHNQSQLNLMGICMGGTFAAIYSTFHAYKVKNLITTVTPINFDTDQGLLHVWMKHVDADRLINAYGNMPGDLMNLGFLLLNPARLMIDKYEGFVENMDNKEFVENFVRMEKWIFDSPDVPGETFRQFIKDCYQKNLLVQSKMEVGGKRVDLKKITMPLLNIYGKFDHLVPPEACEVLTSEVGSDDTEDLCLKTGHIGICVSSKSQKEFAPRIINWLQERDGKDKTINLLAISIAPGDESNHPRAL